jgi:glycosyltransferase involved in cell wall biosynthesis
MHPQKRPLDVVRLARRMANRNVHFLLVGGGPLDRAVDRELARRPLHNLTRLPFRHDTDELIEAADVCLLASEYEGLPVFLLEGMARGIPCVATAVGDIPHLLADGGGLVSGQPGDIAGLERAVEALVDDRRRADEGERARARVMADFGLDRYVREYERAIFP